MTGVPHDIRVNENRDGTGDFAPRTLVEALRTRSGKQPDRVAYTFLLNGEEPGEELTYRDLDTAARARAVALEDAGLGGRSVVMLHGPGLEFVKAFTGCLYAKTAGAPLQVPQNTAGVERLLSVVQDTGCSVVLTDTETRDNVLGRFPEHPELTRLTWFTTDTVDTAGTERWVELDLDPEHTAMLQYTSGSTGRPKGVMVSHRNFCVQAAENQEVWNVSDDDIAVSWLPTFHDMGLMYGVVMPLWRGMRVYLMAPQAFVRRPRRWLEAISRYRGTLSAGPNFAYDMCSRVADTEGTDGLDLSSWRMAVCGAEPVRMPSMERFARAYAPARFAYRALAPGYGLAENTLKVSATPAGRDYRTLWVSGTALATGHVEAVGQDTPGALPVVGNGPHQSGTTVRIVDPVTRRARRDGEVGEIWVQGGSVAKGYWRRPVETRETFRARIADEDSGEFLRTGDLGFHHEGELYPTGRWKDLIIVDGRNLYPQDIEYTVEKCHPALHATCAAAFPVERDGREQLVVLVETNAEVAASGADLPALVRSAVGQRHEVLPADIVLVRRRTLHKTTSGKIRRRACKQSYLDGSLQYAR
ncbi:fatty acyl-AMP ligase [Streptomyces sp. DSM 41527]|uniref:Fatty acyl-AMP ligase n=1 Tax=Streptomyces mooreae TaxID=3075523 RepID=A0ABU2SZP4_9ACTN|nr:fatty acyl-AMP ligase [Streptomyces sp. DSM 41527]MDT0454468.1 fatty acyl-AMP ligase [Streptomyces sp. DSM 41527]